MSPGPPQRRRQSAKLVAVPVLCLVLGWMVFGRHGEEDRPAASHPVTTSPGKPSPSPTRPLASQRPPRPWPDFEMARVIAHNPFSFGDEPQPEEPPAELMAAEEPLQPQHWEVNVYLDFKNRKIALANGHILQVGDIVDDAWRVSQLTKESVLLEPLP